MGIRIMVVDDDPAIREMLEFSLALEGFEVSSAPDGVSALEALINENPDVIVLDVMMPVLSGYEVVRQLRKNPSHASTPVILLTAKATDEDVWEGWSKGVDSYITKPVDINVLVDEIKRVAQHKAVTA